MPSFVQGAASHSYQPTVSGETCYHSPTQQKIALLIHTFSDLGSFRVFLSLLTWSMNRASSTWELPSLCMSWIASSHENMCISPFHLSLSFKTCLFQQLFRTSCCFQARFHVVVFFFWIFGWHKHIFILPWFCWDPIELWSGDHWVPDDISRSHKQWEPRCLHKSWEKAGPELQLKQWTHSNSQDHAFVNVSWCCCFGGV